MEVVIGGINIPIHLKEDTDMKEEYGEFFSDTESISLRKNMPVNLRRKTLVHECLHAYLYISGYSELLSAVDDGLEEAMCRSFEQAMSPMFAFDTDIETWLVKEIEKK